MTTWQIVAVVAGCLFVLAVTAAALGFAAWFVFAFGKLLKSINAMEAIAPDFVLAMKSLIGVADELRNGNKSMEGHVKLGNSLMLEYAKLRVMVDRFSRLVMRPDQERENEKLGFQVPTDADAAKQSFINELVQSGAYNKEDAENMWQASSLGGM